MRILIVDDDLAKLDLIRKFVVSNGVSNNDIVVAEHAAQARFILAKEAIDLMLIDVLLPTRAGAIPKGENCIELLQQIIDDGAMHAPVDIIAITASRDALHDYDDTFRHLVTQILHVTPDSTEWRDSLGTFLNRLKRREQNSTVNAYDVCVLNALRSPELSEILSNWPVRLNGERLLGRNICYQEGVVDVGSFQKRIVCAHLSQMGPVASAHATFSVLQTFRPKLLFMTGICGGFKDFVEIGDIVVAEKSWDWQAGKWTEEGTLLTSPDQKDGAAELVALARGVEDKLDLFYKEFKGTVPNQPPKIVVGPMVSGSSVVASPDIQRVFRSQHRKMAAVDMECYGVYYSSACYSGATAKTLCIKAVSDLADRSKADNFQQYCSYLSARVTYEILCRYFALQ